MPNEKCCEPYWLAAFFGTPDQTLTGGLPLRRRSLYTTELQGHMRFSRARVARRILWPARRGAGKEMFGLSAKAGSHPAMPDVFLRYHKPCVNARAVSLGQIARFLSAGVKELRENAKKDGFSAQNAKKREEYLAIGWGKDYNIWLVQK